MDWQSWIAPLSVLMFLAVGALEIRQPLSELSLPYFRRWSLNFGLWVLVSLLTTAAFRISSIGLAASRPGTLSFLPLLLIHDLLLWASHFGMHNFGPLWIWHSIHHSDPDMDASTSFRFHPIEGLWDQAILLVLVYFLQPTVNAVIGYQIFAMASSFFVHANIALPPRLDAALAWVLMTPGLHRSHHFIKMHSQKSNYGVTLTLWDRFFGTLKRNPDTVTLGIEDVQAESSLEPKFLLATLPLREWKKL